MSLRNFLKKQPNNLEYVDFDRIAHGLDVNNITCRSLLINGKEVATTDLHQSETNLLEVKLLGNTNEPLTIQSSQVNVVNNVVLQKSLTVNHNLVVSGNISGPTITNLNTKIMLFINAFTIDPVAKTITMNPEYKFIV